MEALITKFSHHERDFDLFFMEELSFGAGFFEAFADKVGVAWQPIKEIRHSVHENLGGEAWGETDVLIELQDGTVLLIENKLTADFQPGQAERYRERARRHRESGKEAVTALIAPEVYLNSVSEGEWDRTCSYSEIANCMSASDARGRWRQSLFREAGNRASRVKDMASNSAARKSASKELLAFKTAWLELIKNSSEWLANPQRGAADEFLYAPRVNPFKLRIWHHPFKGYLSVQNLEKHLELDEAMLLQSLPDGFRLKRHSKSTYLNAPVPEIDMSADFSVERMHVEEGMKVARRVLDLAEAAIAERR